VKLPGSDQFVDLVPGMILPPGTIVDLTGGGGIVLTDSNGNQMTLWGGSDGIPAMFVITGQIVAARTTAARAQQTVQNLRLVGGDFTTCPKRSLRTRAAAPPPKRRLFAKGKGNFRTQGRYASATVRGTAWSTADRCDGTLIQVDQGVVTVRDLATKKDRPLGAHHSRLVKPPQPKKKR
jgi:hypothetical protein